MTVIYRLKLKIICFSLILLLLLHICEVEAYSFHVLRCRQRFNMLQRRRPISSLSGVISDAAGIDEFKKRLMDSIEQQAQEKLQLPESIDREVIMTLRELQMKWNKVRRKHHIKETKKGFLSLNEIAPYLLQDGNTIILTNDDPTIDPQHPPLQLAGYNPDDDKEVFITEDELRRVWNEHSQKLFGKRVSEFNVQDALLLLYDGEDEHLMHEEHPSPSDMIIAEESMKNMTSVSFAEDVLEDGLIPLETVISRLAEQPDEPELFISSQELEQSWHERHGYKWGVPCYEYSDENALLQLCDDYEGDFELGSLAGQMRYAPAAEITSDPETYGRLFWGDVEDSALQDSIRRVVDEMEDMTTHRPAWKKAMNILTPDIDTQEFSGDIMFSNTYLTTRIPANWDDPEGDETETSPIYRDTGSMSWPGQPESDYNVKVPLWDALGLDVEPKLPPNSDIERPWSLFQKEIKQKIEDKSTITSSSSSSSSGSDDTPAMTVAEQAIDWANFDFASLDEQDLMEGQDTIPQYLNQATSSSPSSSLSSSSSTKSYSKSKIEEIESFFQALSEKSTSSSNDTISGDRIKVVGRNNQVQHDDDEVYEDIELKPGLVVPMETDDICRNFVIPPAWLERWATNPPNGVEMVGYDVWSKYNSSMLYDGDNEVWVDDIYLQQSIARINEVLKYYIRDHDDFIDEVEKAKYLEKYLNMIFSRYYDDKLQLDTSIRQAAAMEKKQGYGNLPILENKAQLDPALLDEIPPYLVPELHLGVNYTDVIYEMRSKRILQPEPDGPDMWKDDKFTHNEDLLALNQVGTVREQYDWLPQDREHLIEDHVVEKIQPVIRFLNHAAELKSTKDDVIIFNYKGRLRHVIGLREMTKHMARQCYPEMKDLRLETDRKADKIDMM